MPTQPEFLEAARRFEEAASELRQTTNLVAVVWLSRPATSGGALTASINELMTRLNNDGRTMSEQLTIAAEECRLRAGQTADSAAEWAAYDEAFDAYEEAYAAGETGATPPEAPADPPAFADIG